MRLINVLAALVLPLAIQGCTSNAGRSDHTLGTGEELTAGEIAWHTPTPIARPGTENARVMLTGAYLPAEVLDSFNSEDSKLPQLLKLTASQCAEIQARGDDFAKRGSRGTHYLVGNTKTARITFGDHKKRFKAVTIEVVDGGPA
ncbi:MAG: hypothetical protein KBG84_01005, partial [Planctomycetes bacterium]|nr:hypothetical protein [Planctomycetota bacterium]